MAFTYDNYSQESDDSFGDFCSAGARLIKKKELRRKNVRRGSTPERTSGSLPRSAATPPSDDVSPEGLVSRGGDGSLVGIMPRATSHLADPITGIEIQIGSGSSKSSNNTLRAYITIQRMSQQGLGEVYPLTCHLTTRARDFTRERMNQTCEKARDIFEDLRSEYPDDTIVIGHCHPRKTKRKIPGLAGVLHCEAGKFMLLLGADEYIISLGDDLTERQRQVGYTHQGRIGRIVKCAQAPQMTDPLSSVPVRTGY